MPAVVIAVHNDVGFLAAMAGELQKQRIALIPASTSSQAERLLAELKVKPDLLIIECKIRNVCSFAAAMRQRRAALKVVGLISEPQKCARCRELLTTTVYGSRTRMIQWWVALIKVLLRRPRVPS